MGKATLFSQRFLRQIMTLGAGAWGNAPVHWGVAPGTRIQRRLKTSADPLPKRGIVAAVALAMDASHCAVVKLFYSVANEASSRPFRVDMARHVFNGMSLAIAWTEASIMAACTRPVW